MLANSFRRKPSRGFTLIETAIVLGVFAIIIAAIWMVVGVLYERAREHEANLQLQTLLRNVRQLYSRVGEVTTVSATYALTFDEQGLWPPEMKINPGTVDGKVNHPWSTSKNGSITVIGGVSDPNGEKTMFDLIYSALPKKACVALAMQQSEGAILGLAHIKFTSSGTCYGPESGCTAFPIDFTTASNQCHFANTVLGIGQNSVEFRFSIH
jgi:prepilin-type N-terminal cleavage/methylation domain-containing protein